MVDSPAPAAETAQKPHKTADERPYKQAGKTPESRARQLANLKSMDALKHGAYSAAMLRPARERVLAELTQSFPGVRVDLLQIAAAKRARIVLIQEFIDERGIIKNRQRGEFYPVLTLLERLETAYTSDLRRIEELARERRPYDALAELADDDDGASGPASPA
jgi:hypothetical protein